MSIEQMFEFSSSQLTRELFSMEFQHGAGQLRLFLDLFTNELPFIELTSNKLINSPELDIAVAKTKLHRQLLSYQ